MKRLAKCVTVLAIGLASAKMAAQGGAGGRPEGTVAPVLITAEQSDLSPQLRNMNPKAVERLAGVEVPRHKLPIHRGPAAPAAPVDPVVQDGPSAPSVPSTTDNFEGVGNVNGVLPPDPNGDVGPNHYFQTVNLSFAVFSKATDTTPPALLYGPAAGNTLFTGFGGPCEARNDGDPIVLYDHLADRWLFSQLAIPNNIFGLLMAPFYQCIAISATPDPLGAYHRYQFAFGKLNDYPKFGVWPDGYYMTINQYEQLTLAWAGQGAVVFDRAKMLDGLLANGVIFDMGKVDLNLGGMLPSDLDGPPPPVGTPNYFMQLDDDAWSYSGDQLQLWAYSANWNAPLTSTFTHIANLPTAAFDSNLCGYARNCLPQPGTSVKLDALSDRLMYRLQYRNFGTHETLVVNHTVDADGLDKAGVRWYEIRNPSTAPAIFQQGTYAPDSDHRWSASAAMDIDGNIALGFSTVGVGAFPSIRYAGRLASDPLGVLAQGEADIQAGTGSQTHDSGRWGDYSGMVVDPVDGCTFYYTHEYYAGTSVSDWRTRVGTFRFPSCGGGGGGNPPTAPSGLTASAVSSSQIDLTWTDNSDNEDGFTIERCLGSGCTNFVALQPPVASNVTSFQDTGLVAGSFYRYQVRASNAEGSSVSGIAEATTQSPPPPPASSHVGDLDPSSQSVGKGFWRATVTITVHAGDHALINGAAVNGTWTGSGGAASCTTGATGQCSVTISQIHNSVKNQTFTVSGITSGSATYAAAANHDPESDSNGTTIVVRKP